VYDLGSGDGRLVIAAARTFGARGVGVEIDPQLVQDSRENALRAGVADRVSFRWEDLFRADISDATAVMTYLLPDVNVRLQPKLLRELRPGTPIVSHDFGMGEWAPDLTRRIRATDRPHTLYLWIVPASVRGDWSLAVQIRGETRRFALRLEQQFQHVWGSATGDGGETLAVSGTLRGDEVSFSAGPARATLSFRGRATGDSAAGEVHSGEGPTGVWTARRH
jgi:SAM-dependent methyltransferase